MVSTKLTEFFEYVWCKYLYTFGITLVEQIDTHDKS